MLSLLNQGLQRLQTVTLGGSLAGALFYRDAESLVRVTAPFSFAVFRFRAVIYYCELNPHTIGGLRSAKQITHLN